MSYQGNSREFEGILPDHERIGSINKAVALAIVNRSGKIFLLKHAVETGGEWVYPGGIVNSQSTFEETARSETENKAGILLDPESDKLFPLANCISASDVRGVNYDLLAYITQPGVNQLQQTLRPTDDIEDTGWFTPQEIADKASSGEMRMSAPSLFITRRVGEYLSPSVERDYGEVLLGGTFDRLHSGHEQLLAKAFSVGDYVYIGLTTNEYIGRSGKELKERIGSYDERLQRLRAYLDREGVLNRAIIMPLEDSVGPKALDPKLGAIIVSEETQSGGSFVNEKRKQIGIFPMDTIVVPLLRDETGIISSTRLRRTETTIEPELTQQQEKHLLARILSRLRRGRT